MSDLNDADLEELERRVETAFAGTRPRRGFEDELWARLERRRPSPRRWLWRQAPWPALGAVAAVLLVALGVVLVPQLAATRSGQSGSAVQTSAPAAPAERGAATRPGLAQTADGGFGRLPSPALAIPGATRPGTSAAVDAPAYDGPAELTVTATLAEVPATLTVYRYSLPTSAELDRFAAGLGASRAGTAGTPTIYLSADFRLDLVSLTAGGREPRFVISQIASPGTPAASPGSPPERIAGDFLGRHGIQPVWPAEVVVQPTTAGGDRVTYQRDFAVPGLGPAGQVDQLGSRTGLEVEVAAGAVTGASGPLPLPLQTSEYRTRPYEQARAAVPSAGSGAAAGSNVPKIALDQVRLVYMAVNDGAQGYFVPAYLFTGKAPSGQEKRVLVPALDASQLR
jgi:hypothetical protein